MVEYFIRKQVSNKELRWWDESFDDDPSEVEDWVVIDGYDRLLEEA